MGLLRAPTRDLRLPPIVLSDMAIWSDLPQEIKQLIFCMVTETESIVYVPRDRRMKIDRNYLAAQHFHDLLLVSKTFITPNELAFALLGTASLKFYTYNELRRLIADVNPAFKNCVRRIHLCRAWDRTPDHRFKYEESFNRFSKIATTLSTNFPELKRIYISLPDWCANIGYFHNPQGPFPPTKEEYSEILQYCLSQGSRLQQPVYFKPRANSLAHVAAGFIGNRRTMAHTGYGFTRPQAWLRRLLLFAEEANIEVTFQVQLCVATRASPSTITSESYGQSADEPCFSNRNGMINYNFYHIYHSWRTDSRLWVAHHDAEMSTKDWMLRVKNGGQEYAIHQQLGYEMVHGPNVRSVGWWLSLLRDIKHSRNGHAADF